MRTSSLNTAAAFAAVVIAGIIALTSGAFAVPVQHSERVSADMTRACIQASGHATKLTISGTSAASSQLTGGTVYEVTCTTAVYIEWGDAAAATADANSNYLPADMTRYYATGGGDVSRYVSAVQVSSAGSCFVQECK